MRRRCATCRHCLVQPAWRDTAECSLTMREQQSEGRWEPGEFFAHWSDLCKRGDDWEPLDEAAAVVRADELRARGYDASGRPLE